MTEDGSDFAKYLKILKDQNAAAFAHLKPGVSEDALDAFEEEFSLKLPVALRELWTRFDGMEEGARRSGRTLFPHFFPPVSLVEARESYLMFADLRETAGDDLEAGFKLHFPTKFVCFASIDAGGFWINCDEASPTYGAVYVRLLTSDPLTRYANGFSQLFQFFNKALNEGIIFVADKDDDLLKRGDVGADEEELVKLGLKLMPDCPAHDDDLDWHLDLTPDWIRSEPLTN